jgi:hypothetical protein
MAMKCEITEGGTLMIVRAHGVKKVQVCPFSGGAECCSHDCPHFNDGTEGLLCLTCGGTGVAMEISKDERVKKS